MTSREPPPVAQPAGAAATTAATLEPRPWDSTVPDVMTALRAGVPISLLIDLAALDGPDSAGILATERSDADAEWIPLPTQTMTSGASAHNRGA